MWNVAKRPFLPLLGLMLTLSSPAGAQTYNDPAPRLTGQLPGCRSVSLMSEGYVGPGYRLFLTLFNPLGVAQNVEVQLFDDGSMSPPFSNWVAPPGRRSYDLLTDRAAFLTTFRAVSASVRWELGGVAHLTTWAIPERVPISPADWVAWIQAWRLVGYGPTTQVVICQ